MIDHIFLPVSDLNRSSEFYKKLLEPLGIDMPFMFDQPPIRGFAINNNPGFWLKNGEVAKDLYVAFAAKSADAVRASYKAAIDAGATSNKEPSLRPEWRADYFAANIGDPVGYNIEIAYTAWLYKYNVRAIYPSEASRHSPASSRCCGNLASPPEPQHPTSRLPGCESERPRSRRTERQLRILEGRARQTALGRDRRSSASDCDRPLWRRPFEPLSGRSWPGAGGWRTTALTPSCRSALDRAMGWTPPHT